jgi:two-component system response regulator YesN
MFLLRMLLTDVLVTMFNAVPSGEQGTEVQQAIVATSRALQKAMTHAEAEEQMDTLIGAVAVKYTSSAETDQPELLSRILQCVQDFNVSRAADLLGLSVAYLSKYFKQQTGVNLLNYLNSLRIDYAKKLMDEEQITVAEAADRAGYESANTFIRLFKKYAGDTPGNYNKH